jgi:DNA-binding FadR family transcriptional regulator
MTEPNVVERRPRRDGASGSRVDEAYRKILAMISSGAFGEGDRLPSEAELAANAGVSRPVVRQALSRLQHSGIVKVRWGAGTYVQNARGAAANEPSLGTVRGLDEVRHAYVFRAAMEGDAAALAAELRLAAPIAAAWRALEKLETVLDTSVEAQDADLAFHFALAQASGNPFFERVLRSIQRTLEFSIGLTRSLSLTHPHGRRLIVQAEHVAVLTSIEAGDPAAARDAMRRHLANACQRLFEGPGDTV